LSSPTFLFICLSLLLLSCSAADQNDETQNNSSSTTTLLDSTYKPTHEQYSEVKTTSTTLPFQLPLPKPEQTTHNFPYPSASPLYNYLVSNFDSLAPKSLKDSSGIIQNPCEFSQQFSGGIHYYQSECSSGASQYILRTPLTNISNLKALFAVLFEAEDNYVWSTDSLSHKTSTNGISGAGGTYHYEQVGDHLKITILYTD
jgi:hypothetical protein